MSGWTGLEKVQLWTRRLLLHIDMLQQTALAAAYEVLKLLHSSL